MSLTAATVEARARALASPLIALAVHGVPIGFMAAAVDDTERATAEAHARASASLLRATVDSFLDPWVYLVAVRDLAGHIVDFVYTDANRTACAHNGTTSPSSPAGRAVSHLERHHRAGADAA